MQHSVCFWARKCFGLLEQCVFLWHCRVCASMGMSCVCVCVCLCQLCWPHQPPQACMSVLMSCGVCVCICVYMCVCVCPLTVSMQHFQRPLLVWTTPLSCSYPSLTPHSFLHPGEKEWKKRGGGWGGSGNNRLLSQEGLWKKGARGEKRRERNMGEKRCLLCVLVIIQWM